MEIQFLQEEQSELKALVHPGITQNPPLKSLGLTMGMWGVAPLSCRGIWAPIANLGQMSFSVNCQPEPFWQQAKEKSI